LVDWISGYLVNKLLTMITRNHFRVIVIVDAAILSDRA